MSLIGTAHNFVIESSTLIHNSHVNGARTGIERLEEFTLKQALRDSADREIPCCFEGTRTAHREQIMSWGKGQWKSKKARVMWMDGPAGVGKSAIAQTWADEMGKLLSAAFFFSRVNGWNQAIKLFPTVAFQLATKYDSYRTALDKAITRNPLILEKSPDAQFQALIVQPTLESSLEDRDAMADTMIIIDGFDECGAFSGAFDSFQTQLAIIDVVITSAANNTSPFLWGVFSRPETHIVSALQNKPASNITWRLTLPLKAPNADEDIEAYLRGAFETIRRKYPSISSSWPPDRSLMQLVERADGLFIYATSAIRYIEQNTGGSRLGPEERLQVLLRPDEEGRRAKLSKLDRLYLLIMDQIPKETLPSTLIILYAYDYLSVVRSGSSRKIWLTIPVISSVLGLSQPAFHDAITPLRSVLQEYTQQGMSHPSLQFFHSSFTEFLANPARSQANYHIQTNEICTLFYSACVDILCQPPPVVSKRHPRYKDYESQEQKEIVVRQAAFTILFSIPSWVEYFRLSEHPDILAKMTQIDWNLHARAYEASALLQIYTYSTISKQIPWNWRPRIIRPKKGFHQLIYKVLGPSIGDKLVLKRTDKFVLGCGDKKALIDGSDLEPYHHKFE
ncbi:hypothetical protein NP233_g8620 [Leucocoprinus birnbaumii]|uniref:Nephrocystin 3-like N-terminal domain-containing protein n=1 Tax=Leucocoprinus birnbaumii TaxID=56174 RepID=A0AAD5VM34_9AGAR|nr:hypothetical protein NP233_g8620 [Leucocoprinus birnbaumii]